MAVIYRSERKKVFLSQQLLTAFVIDVLTRSMKLQINFKNNQLTKEDCLKQYQDQYLGLMENEQDQLSLLESDKNNDTLPVFDSDENEKWY